MMAGFALTTQSKLQCPHGGQVQIISANAQTSAGGGAMVTVNDQFVISGCPFQLPGPVASPCVTVRWLIPDKNVSVLGQQTLSRGSTGLCMSAAQVPQGPVAVNATQTKIQTM